MSTCNYFLPRGSVGTCDLFHFKCDRIAELSACKMRRLNQLNATYFNLMRVQSNIRLNPVEYTTKVRQLI